MKATAPSATPLPGSELVPLVLRGTIGGTLMGLANLVPGISGGTMLLAVGVYPGFIRAIAEVTTLRFRPRSVVLLATIAAAAAIVILLLAGTVKSLVEDHRWIMYSLFIGLTLGGLPLIWKMARPATAPVWIAAVVAFGVMCAMAFGQAGGGVSAESAAMMFVAGIAGASAMILPGISGGYLLLLLGVYEAILGTIDRLRVGLLGDATAGSGFDLAIVLDAMGVVIPLGLGIVVGIVGVSNLLKWLLKRYAKATLGALLGLLLGAIVGLWPFQESVAPQPGDLVKGQMVTAENLDGFDREDWPLHRFAPGTGQQASAVGLVAIGLLATLAIGRLSRSSDPDN